MHKKKTNVHAGARVRVADPLVTGDDRWTNASLGTVHKEPQGQAGCQVLIDGQDNPIFVYWSDLDVEQKPRPTWLELPVGLIRPSRWQYRRRFDPDTLLELALSIERAGLINRPLLFKDEDGGHELIAGERRVRACCALAIKAGRPRGPEGTPGARGGDVTRLADAVVIVSAADWWSSLEPYAEALAAYPISVELRHGSAADFREIVILENLQREDPSPVEEAEGFQSLIDEEHYTQTQLATRLGKSQAYVSQRLGLLGLAPAARAAVAEQELSFTAARAIATVQPQVQAAMARHVAELSKTAGVDATTSRKVQAMATQLRKFLDPDHWAPPAGETITPGKRNRLRLVAHSLRSLTPERAEAILALRHDNSRFDDNVLGRSPLALANDDRTIRDILGALAGKQTTIESAWTAAAADQTWTCRHCRLLGAPGPAQGDRSPCLRWTGGRDPLTCISYIDPDDPVVLPVSYEAKNWAERLGITVLTGSSINYLDDHDPYRRLQDGAHRLAREADAARKQQESQAHLVDLRAYWAAQNDPRTLVEQEAAGDLDRRLDTAHPQAHACRLCVQFVNRYGTAADGRDALPPCRFADRPVKRGPYDNRTTAPAMGILVRDDGLMVPRCERFRLAEPPALATLPGITFPKTHRPHVLAWLSQVAKTGQSYNHDNTLTGVLAWLPYPRDEEKETHDRDKMVAYVRQHWDALGGDPAVAHLLTVARAEAVAIGKHQQPLELINPVDGTLEHWATIFWETYVNGDNRYHWHNSYPDTWPTPWKRAPQPQPAPTSNKLVDVIPADAPVLPTAGRPGGTTADPDYARNTPPAVELPDNDPATHVALLDAAARHPAPTAPGAPGGSQSAGPCCLCGVPGAITDLYDGWEARVCDTCLASDVGAKVFAAENMEEAVTILLDSGTWAPPTPQPPDWGSCCMCGIAAEDWNPEDLDGRPWLQRLDLPGPRPGVLAWLICPDCQTGKED